MLEEEIKALIEKVRNQQCESQYVEVKSAAKGCPERLYDTISAFSNQDDGGVILFGLDESQGFAKVGVYDAQSLQKKLAEVGEEMTPIVRPVISIYVEKGKQFVVAEIPPLDVSERPCFKTARGRVKGSFIRVGESDKPMTEYEVYTYEAYRRRTHDELRPLPDVTDVLIDETLVEAYLALRQQGRTNFAASMTREQLWSTMGFLREGKFTLLALLLFGRYPQATFPQLAIVACRVAGEELFELGVVVVAVAYAAGGGEAHPVDKRGVHQLVRQHQHPPVPYGGEDSGVEVVAAGGHEGGFLAVESGQLLLYPAVGGEGAGQQPGGRGRGEEAFGRLPPEEFGAQGGVGSQSQVVVGREVVHLPSVCYDELSFAFRPGKGAVVAFFFQAFQFCLQALLKG